MGLKLRIGVMALALLATTMFNSEAMAGNGRYQALLVQEGKGSALPKVLLLDTQEGHLWTWSESYTKVSPQGGGEIGTFLEYQGKLRPGQKMGDRIEMKAKW
jgi:hypothetical protein